MSCSPLCSKCTAFDISALYELASQRVRCSKPVHSTTGGFAAYEGFPTFYSHHSGLQALSKSAREGCLLCHCIWKQSIHLLGFCSGDIESHVLDDYAEQIFLGLSNWSPESDGLPYLTASQPRAKNGLRQLATFDVFADDARDGDGSESLLARRVESDSASEASLSIAQCWKKTCSEQHKNCASLFASPHPMPSRVIEVGNVEQNPKLILTKGQKGAWAALSYCWGGDSQFKLTQATKDLFLLGQYTTAQYPRTLADAILITRKLDIQYLWIDAVCIFQDSAEDWATEAARMRDVYGRAVVTIAATGSCSSSAGIFHQREVSSPLCSLGWGNNSNLPVRTVFLRPASDFWDVNMKREVLNTRGWTLQEGLLSPRTLSYSSQQMLWECLQLKTGENGRPILPGERHRDKAFIQRLARDHISPQEKVKLFAARLSLRTMPVNRTFVPQSWEEGYDAMYCRWFAIIKDFTGRNLTIQSDTLPALSGLAATFQNIIQDDYVAGLWKHDVIRGLCWSRKLTPTQQDRGVVKATDEANGSYLPSWSWTSVSGGIIQNYLAEETEWPFITVEETSISVKIQVKPRFDDPFGQLASASLVIKGPFCQIDDPLESLSSRNGHSDSEIDKHFKVHLSIDAYRDEFNQKHKAHEDQKFAVLRLMKTSKLFVSSVLCNDMYLPGASLLLLETTCSAKEVWRRIGFSPISVEAFPDEDNASKLLMEEMDRNKWEIRSLTLV